MSTTLRAIVKIRKNGTLLRGFPLQAVTTITEEESIHEIAKTPGGSSTALFTNATIQNHQAVIVVTNDAAVTIGNFTASTPTTDTLIGDVGAFLIAIGLGASDAKVCSLIGSSAVKLDAYHAGS